ncbi:Hypothetical protein BCO_0111600 [Borrelia coriaceae ATCC 43381]|uniref:PEGA domain-containing protein n=1 Tax=Borrelia coriaceae ATCC 43381 TaxID=1408429 RepID=W5SYM8_9SPIR|nr:PEGA domain-containing protein [Borrelia coriaceae]AHH10186.1 Hypothetical protein BCO_0111600 [Borrelia coriaceae ATCC 43381]
MFKKNDGFNINEELLTVKLKPILGIIPKVYVTFTIIILPLIIILSLIINTKLNNPGAYLKIKTNINNAHVYLDEKYIGRTPLKKYINATKGTIKIQRLGFESYEKKIEIQHRFFTSYQLNIDLKLKDPDKIIAQRQKELSIMTKIKNTNDNTKLIPIFSFIVNDLQSSPKHIKNFLKPPLHTYIQTQYLKTF